MGLSVCLSAYLSACTPTGASVCLSVQVCGVLESLEQEYRREEDWCGGGDRQPEQLMPLINKHMEQKEAFLKVTPPPPKKNLFPFTVSGL